MKNYCNVHWFAERDIDVLLAVELKVNPDFSRWFLDKIEAPSSILVPAVRTRVSIVEDRETDVEALFHTSDGNNFVVLVEDKIKADFQYNQMEDYIKRAERGKSDKKWAAFAVVVFAPSYRVFSLPSGVMRLNFEDAADQFELQGANDARAIYRAEFLKRAAQQQIIIVENVDGFVREWWNAVNAMVKQNFGDLFHPQKPRKTTYVNPHFSDKPSYLRLDLKGNQGKVALAFIGFSEEQLSYLAADNNKPENVEVIKDARWKDPVLQIGKLDKFDVNDGMEVIGTRVRAAYQAAHGLVSFWKANRPSFDHVAAELQKSGTLS
jgi:hypothetical protein